MIKSISALGFSFLLLAHSFLLLAHQIPVEQSGDNAFNLHSSRVLPDERLWP